MNLLLLGEKALLLKKHLEEQNHLTVFKNVRLSFEDVLTVDFIVSFGYKFILPQEIISIFPHKIVNLHISYLPFNRGADPNLWSFLENTPKGITIHEIDKNIDTGDILLQKTVEFGDNETLKTTYDKLITEISSLFIENSEKIFNRQITPVSQKKAGTRHQKSDKNKFLYLVASTGYDTPVKELIGKGLENK